MGAGSTQTRDDNAGDAAVASGPRRDHTVPLGEVLAHHAASDPARPALTHDGITVSYAELDERASRRAVALAAVGVGVGDLVVVMLPNEIGFFETTFAIWKLGATPCPVSPKMPVGELRAILDVARPKVIVGPRTPTLDEWSFTSAEPDSGSDAPWIAGGVAPRWKALTSGGSTGRPKVILTEAEGLVDPAGGGYALQLAGETILNPGPLYHNAAFSAAHQCLFAGGHVINMARYDAEQALALIERHRVGHVVMVPTMMHRIWQLPTDRRHAYDLSSLRLVVHLAAACPAWLKEAWIDWLGPDRLVEIYAGTEGVGATCISGREWLEHRGSVGRVVGDTELAVFDENGSRCAPGEIGEVFFRQASGQGPRFSYLGAEAKASDGWRSLGDLGHLDVDGYLYLADRRTDLIVSGGANIFPAEVEGALDRHPSVKASVVIGLPDEDLGARVHAIVQVAPREAARLTGDELAAYLADLLVRYKIPRSFEIVEHDLKDEAGKVRRSKLRDERDTGATGVGE